MYSRCSLTVVLSRHVVSAHLTFNLFLRRFSFGLIISFVFCFCRSLSWVFSSQLDVEARWLRKRTFFGSFGGIFFLLFCFLRVNIKPRIVRIAFSKALENLILFQIMPVKEDSRKFLLL